MINNSEKQHYLAVRSLKGIFLKKTGHSGECCLNWLKLFVNKSSFKNINFNHFHNQNLNQFHNQ